MNDLERLVAIQAIHDLKGRRDHAVDRKDWDTYARLHTDDYVAMASEYQALSSLPGIETAKVWEPVPATMYIWERESAQGART